MTDTSNWEYYYKLTQDGYPTDSNMLYTPKMNPEKNILCMHYCVDQDYRKNGTVLEEDLIQWFFDREVRFLNELSHFKTTPSVVDVDLANRKIFIEWNKETLSQVVFDKSRNLDEELPDWKDQIKDFLLATKANSIYKMSLYPHCFFIDKNKVLKTIDYYAVVPYTDRFIERRIIEGVIGKHGAYRFDESTNNHGYVDFKQFFEITLTKHLELYWPSSPFGDLFKELYGNE
jgi:hypothetical protein